MTEAKLRACTDPTPMLEFLYGKVSDRKLRLFACACVRQVWHLLTDERSRMAIEVSELFADEKVSKEELRSARDAAGKAAVANSGYAAYAADAAADIEDGIDRVVVVAQTVVYVWEWEVNDDGSLQTPSVKEFNQYSAKREEAQRHAQVGLFRCIFGDLLRLAVIDASWLSWNEGTVPKIAQSIYDERAFDRMPILADALEDAGCDNADILTHCRSDAVHVRGCWVIDLFLGKQ